MIQPQMWQYGPADHGRRMTYDEYMAGDYRPWYIYELIEGQLYVSSKPEVPAALLDMWLLQKFMFYAETHKDILGYCTNKPRVFMPGQEDQTVTEPDFAAYTDFPRHLPWKELHWHNVSPALVAEILTADDPDKDLVRNVRLFWQIPSIKEYWVF